MDPKIQTMFNKAIQDFQLGHFKNAEKYLVIALN